MTIHTAAKILPVCLFSVSLFYIPSLRCGAVLWMSRYARKSDLNTDGQTEGGSDGREDWKCCMPASDIILLWKETTVPFLCVSVCLQQQYNCWNDSSLTISTYCICWSIITRKLKIYWCLSRWSRCNLHYDIMITSSDSVIVTSLPDGATAKEAGFSCMNVKTIPHNVNQIIKPMFSFLDEAHY